MIEPNGIIEYIAEIHYKLDAATPELARLKSGFLLKEMMERFSKKSSSTLEPDRSFWLYSAHDGTIANILNSLGLFDVTNCNYTSNHLKKLIRFVFSNTLHHLRLVFILNYIS